MARNQPRNITPHLRRLTVSAHELASLGWLHGTVGRLRKGLGMSFAFQTGEFTMPNGRLDTASLQVEQLWPRELIKFGVAVIVAAALIITLALIGSSDPEPTDLTSPAAAMAVDDDSADLPAAPEPVPLLTDSQDEAPALVTPKKIKKKRKRIKKRRKRKHRRR